MERSSFRYFVLVCVFIVTITIALPVTDPNDNNSLAAGSITEGQHPSQESAFSPLGSSTIATNVPNSDPSQLNLNSPISADVPNVVPAQGVLAILANNPTAASSQFSPDSGIAANSPNAPSQLSTDGSIAANDPTAASSQLSPDSSMAANNPNAPSSQPSPDSSIAANDPTAASSQLSPDSSMAAKNPNAPSSQPSPDGAIAANNPNAASPQDGSTVIAQGKSSCAHKIGKRNADGTATVVANGESCSSDYAASHREDLHIHSLGAFIPIPNVYEHRCPTGHIELCCAGEIDIWGAASRCIPWGPFDLDCWFRPRYCCKSITLGNYGRACIPVENWAP